MIFISWNIKITNNFYFDYLSLKYKKYDSNKSYWILFFYNIVYMYTLIYFYNPIR